MPRQTRAASEQQAADGDEAADDDGAATAAEEEEEKAEEGEARDPRPAGKKRRCTEDLRAARRQPPQPRQPARLEDALREARQKAAAAEQEAANAAEERRCLHEAISERFTPAVLASLLEDAASRRTETAPARAEPEATAV